MFRLQTSTKVFSRITRNRILNTSKHALINKNYARSITYKAPLRETSFVLHELLNIEEHYTKLGQTDCDRELIDTMINECAKFSEQELAPLYANGDLEGCQLSDDGKVTTPTGWKEAYQKFRDGGWMGLSIPKTYGGQGLPLSMGVLRSDLIGTANWAWSMYPGLTLGATNTLLLHGSDGQKRAYVRMMAEGKWLGTMCLTEPHCGSDLGQVKTQAIKQNDGSYQLTGNKIFISCGDHDWTENIVHIALARVPGAPEGNKGLSLFIVPKYEIISKTTTENPPWKLSNQPNVICSRLEKKMGIHGSSTCEIVFDKSKGFLIGKENDGLKQMFTFMNTARLGTALQGVSSAELAYQNSRTYARDRLAFRSLQEPIYPEKPADPLIVHPDVRRMLLFQRAIAEGGRAMVYHAAMLSDFMFDLDPLKTNSKANNNVKTKANSNANSKYLSFTDPELSATQNPEEVLSFITPIIKGFLTEMGVEASDLAIQIWGGHGYIQDNGIEQIYRDARISTIYEGTTGIQALDLLGRKVMLQNGKPVLNYCYSIARDCRQIILGSQRGSMAWGVYEMLKAATSWQTLTVRLMVRAKSNRDMVGAASHDYLMYSGYVMMGHWWLKMSDIASKALNTQPDLSETEKHFYQAKLHTAQYYFEHILPRRHFHAKSMMGSLSSLMQMKEQDF